MQVRVRATDGGGAAATATALITVERNLNDPVFTNVDIAVSIEENNALADPFVAVTAIDGDILVRKFSLK